MFYFCCFASVLWPFPPFVFSLLWACMLWSVWACRFKYNHRASLFSMVTSPNNGQRISCSAANEICRWSPKCHPSRIPSPLLFYLLSLKSIIYKLKPTTESQLGVRFTIEIHKNKVHYEEIKVSKRRACIVHWWASASSALAWKQLFFTVC